MVPLPPRPLDPVLCLYFGDGSDHVCDVNLIANENFPFTDPYNIYKIGGSDAGVNKNRKTSSESDFKIRF